MNESEIQSMNDSSNESLSHSQAQSWIQSASHSKSDSASHLWIESWGDLPNASAGRDAVSVQRLAPRCGPCTG